MGFAETALLCCMRFNFKPNSQKNKGPQWPSPSTPNASKLLILCTIGFPYFLFSAVRFLECRFTYMPTSVPVYILRMLRAIQSTKLQATGYVPTPQAAEAGQNYGGI